MASASSADGAVAPVVGIAAVAPAAEVVATSPSGEHHKFSLRFPVVKSQNQFEKEDAESQRECAMTVVDMLIADSSAALPCLNFLKKRTEQRSKIDKQAAPDDQFLSLSTFGKLEMDFCIQAAAKVSDITPAEILVAMKVEEQTPRQMLQACTFWQLNLQIGNDGRIKAVLMDLLLATNEANGQPLKDLKARAGLNRDGSINWKRVGLYVSTFEGDELTSKLTKLTFFNKDEVVIDASGVTREWSIRSNFSVWDAEFELKPHTTPVHKFFKDVKKGPYASKKLGGKSKEFDTQLAVMKAAYLQRVGTGTSSRFV
jgi:hypothetical protein